MDDGVCADEKMSVLTLRSGGSATWRRKERSGIETGGTPEPRSGLPGLRGFPSHTHTKPVCTVFVYFFGSVFSEAAL